MEGEKVVVAVEDKTSYAGLEAIADALAVDNDVELLYLDRLVRRDTRDMQIPRHDIPHPGRDVVEFIRFSPFDTWPESTPRRIVQRLLADSVDHQLIFDVDGYLQKVDPDVIVSAVDQVPFLRQLVYEAHRADIGTVVLQHGTYERALDPELIGDRFLFPNVDSGWWPLERLKRQLGFRYGVAVYCHPYVDKVLSLGEFFTERIQYLRRRFPDFDHTDVVTTGSPEYDAAVHEYTPKSDSILYLGQHEVEGGNWEWEVQEQLMDYLERLDERVPLTIRPHPKATARTTNALAERFDLSRDNTLGQDVDDHDIVVTHNSTALFEAVLKGKPCGVIQLPGYPVTQRPFTHEHLIQFTPEIPDIGPSVAERSSATQREYLRRFCHTPALVDDEHDNSLEHTIAQIESTVG